MSFENIQSTIKVLPKMQKHMINDFIRLLEVPSTSDNEKLMFLFLVKELESIGIPYTVDQSGNIIIHKGQQKNRPCFVSHMDTVHYWVNPIKVEKYDSSDHIYLTSEDGIGGDDKCGIFICLELLKRLDSVSVVFFSREEVGGDGSHGINLKEFTECNSIIGIDRWGNSDYINKYSGRNTTSVDFENALFDVLLKYEYLPTHGLMTDSLILFNRGVGIPCINISCGYYQHHTVEEYIDTNEVLQCLNLCLDIANEIIGKPFTHIQESFSKTIYGYEYGYGYDYPKYSSYKPGYTAPPAFRSTPKKKKKSHVRTGVMYSRCDICGKYDHLDYYNGLYACKDCIPTADDYLKMIKSDHDKI